MNSTQIGFTVFFCLIGIFEIISNLFHLSKGSVEKIGLSAKKQHGEIPDNLPLKHYFIKAVIMLILGIIYTIIGSLLIINNNYLTSITVSALSLLGIYGFIQALIYRRPIKVWISAIAYNIPLVIHILLVR